MRARTITVTLVVLACTGAAAAQSPPGPRPQSRSTAPVHANLNQVMRGILFPSSNVIFTAQSDDPAAEKPAADPSISPNPLTGAYGGWQAVENAALALSESASLLTIPGRVCANGRPVPLRNADWPKFVQELRDAGMVAYKAAQARSQDRIVEAADAVVTACAHCHDKYRETPKAPVDRCM